MSWNGSGTYTPPAASFPEVNGTLVDAARFNNTINDIATGITNCVTIDGQNAATANLLMGGFKHTGAAAASASGEYLVHSQADGRLADLTLASALTAWGSGLNFLDLNTNGAVFSNGSGLQLLRNSYFDGTDYRAKTASAGFRLNLLTTKFSLYSAPSVAAGAVQTFTEILEVNSNGVLTGSGLSSTYTPTLTNSLNVASSTPGVCMYTRLGDVVRVSGTLVLDPTAAGVAVLYISLPVASNLVVTGDLVGIAIDANATTSGVLSADTAGNRALLGVVAPSGTALTLTIDFSYVVL